MSEDTFGEEEFHAPATKRKVRRERKRQPCKKVSLQWTTAEESDLIVNIKPFSCLYDPDCEEAKNKQCRVSAWEAIAAAVDKENITADECHAKWNSLRGTYRRMLSTGRIPIDGEIPVTNYWPHLFAMDFLRDKTKSYRIQTESIFIQVFVFPLYVFFYSYFLFALYNSKTKNQSDQVN